MSQRIVLGMGAGQCGLSLLFEILAKQASSRMTMDQAPVFPWAPDPKESRVKERLSRWKKQFQERFVGDVATFYLPYVEQFIAEEPECRLICLKRPREEVVASFCKYLDEKAPNPTDHWSDEPAPGWYHDPIWSRAFPQYPVRDRVEGCGLYWEEYYRRAEDLAQRFPQNFILRDADVLTSENGVREILDFAGVPRDKQILIVGNRPSRLPTLQEVNRTPRPLYPDPKDPRRCVVLVPFSGFIHQDCDNALKELEKRGYHVRRVAGYAAIDQGRNQMSTDALIEGYDEQLWVDSDVGFNPDDVEKLRSHGLPLTCGIYPQKGKRALACHVAPGADRMVFGKGGGLAEILFAGTGFLLIRRQVYLDLLHKLKLPVCNERFGHPMFPFYHPMLRPTEDGHWYLAEDYAFCERARQCGYKIFADTSIRLWHIGTYRYGWEDAGMERPRFDDFTLNFSDTRDPRSASRRAATTEIENFTQAYPWPSSRPDVPAPPERNWLFPAVRRVMSDTVPRDATLVVEVGSWLGRSTRFLADLAPRARIVAIDHWVGSPEHQTDAELAPLLPRLYETFLSECWDYRERIVPVRKKSIEGLRLVAEAGLNPDVIYIDGDHSYAAVHDDLVTALGLFPRSAILGDDWDWPGVKQAVEEIVQEKHLKLEVFETGWRIRR